MCRKLAKVIFSKLHIQSFFKVSGFSKIGLHDGPPNLRFSLFHTTAALLRRCIRCCHSHLGRLRSLPQLPQPLLGCPRCLLRGKREKGQALDLIFDVDFAPRDRFRGPWGPTRAPGGRSTEQKNRRTNPEIRRREFLTTSAPGGPETFPGTGFSS